MKTIISLLVVVFLGLCAWGFSAFASTPRYQAQAEFSINWDQMGGGDENYDPIKARRDFDRRLSKLEPGDAVISQIQEACQLSEADGEQLLKNLRHHLVIKRIGSTNDAALYRIVYADDRRKVALQAVNFLNQQIVDAVNASVKLGHVKSGVSDFSDREKAADQEAQARNEVARLEQEQAQEYSSERAARIQALNETLDTSDKDQTMAGLRTLVDLVQLFNSPAEIIQPATLKRTAGANPT